jgi:hypothetical protein
VRIGIRGLVSAHVLWFVSLLSRNLTFAPVLTDARRAGIFLVPIEITTYKKGKESFVLVPRGC